MWSLDRVSGKRGVVAMLLLLGLIASCVACPRYPAEPPARPTPDMSHINLLDMITEDAHQIDSGDAMMPSSDDGLPDDGEAAENSPQRSCAVELSYDAGGAEVREVTASGEWNGWDVGATRLQREGERWVTELELAPGRYGYKFVVDGVFEGAPPVDRATKWSGDVENRALVVEDCQVPLWRVLRSGVSEGGRVEVEAQLVRAASGAALDPASVRVTVGEVSVEPEIDAARGVVRVSYEAPSTGKYSVRLWGADVSGQGAQQSPLWVPLWHEAPERAFRWRDALIYLIFTDRFLDSDGETPGDSITDVLPIAGYMGGDFAGVLQRLKEGYFEELGVNVLWLSPTYDNPDGSWGGGERRFTGFHGYWAVDPFRAEDRFGDVGGGADERLRELIRAAHARGMRVMFDVVLNQVHEEHVYCRERPEWCVRTCGCGSQECPWDGPNIGLRRCQFAGYLPDMDHRDDELLQRQMDDTMRLAESLDVDGFRIDAVKHMDAVVLRELRLRVTEVEAQGGAAFYLLGETFTGSEGRPLIMEYMESYGLHGQFDFPLMYMTRDVFGRGASFRDLEGAVAQSEREYGRFYQHMSPFVGNHDIPRFVTDALDNDGDRWDATLDVMAQGGDEVSEMQREVIARSSMAHAFALTQPGLPLLYYGDEVGLAGSGDPDNRRMMPWEWNAAQRELHRRVGELGRARGAERALRVGVRRALWFDDTLYVYARVAGPGEVVVVAMHKGEEGERREEVRVPGELGLEGRRLVRVAGVERATTVSGGRVEVVLGPWEYVVWRAE